ncbi:MAG: nucleotide-binding protein [Liquorilactobacillus nagelii]|jgi:nucleoside 2-deoxyribosyltransferase|uniref:TIR domain-containing protein n=1 Tax=Liquorilactobacillus nagelii TaxID=82688 RepID=UPI002432AA64|nr:TIR domain-containing protein [Liquorilactobacillus nagelii]MCI1920454.1 nucleotide-binding protein [Liquorilactobacillus nagelii]MCI1976098.1 nucleotide-binding protein [Liquorilactobacillus nagelii]
MANKVYKGFFITPIKEKDSDEYKNSIHISSLINNSFHSENISAKLSRVDQLHHTGNILKNVLLEIRKSDFVIADLTGQNPNVYYELGVARGISKNTICICQKENYDLASDIGGDYTIPYNLLDESSELEFTNDIIQAFKELNFNPNLHSMADLYYEVVDEVKD